MALIEAVPNRHHQSTNGAPMARARGWPARTDKLLISWRGRGSPVRGGRGRAVARQGHRITELPPEEEVCAGDICRLQHR